MKPLPNEFVSRMQALLGDAYGDYENALREAPVKGFRLNTAKIAPEDFAAVDVFSDGRIPYVKNGYYLSYDKIGNHPFHHAGMLYVQEPGAMAPAECVEIEPDWKILDMCAAPGGKSTQLRLKLGEGGVLVSNEIIASRCKILTGNIERLGLTDVVTTCMDSAKIAKTFPAAFDMIMVDAPCSGEGMFRKEEVAIDEWSPDNVTMCAARQAEILDNAVRALKDGGVIVYATCTFSLEENERTVDAFLRRHPSFVLAPVTEAVRAATADGIRFEGCACENMADARRFYPHVGRGEGQFMAVLRDTTVPAEGKKRDKKGAEKPVKVDPAVFRFLDEVLTDYEKDHVTVYNGNPVYFTPNFTVPKGAAFACGVTIGEVGKNHVIPHHQFFMAMGKHFRRQIELAADSEALARYLHGEEIDVACENGWAVVTVCGCAVGGAKVVNGRAKNHYPKGLRTK